MGLKTAKNVDITNPERTFIRTYKRRVYRSSAPHMSEDIVLQILVRLPVKDLLRFKTVCKAWRVIIAAPWFIRMHLQHSALQNKQSFLIVPHTLDPIIEEDMWPSTFSNNIPFYRWQKNHDTARLLLAKDFHGDFGSVYCMSQRDGLVLFPTDNKVYVINPAIRDILVLPHGQRDVLLTTYNEHQTIGFGLDPRTRRYKVARFFYRAVDVLEQSYSIGMEVLTICDDDNDASWRETLEDPLYPIYEFDAPAYFKGSLFWRIGSYIVKQSAKGFLRFHLEDETFSMIPQPASALDDDDFQIMERGEQLYLAQYQSLNCLMIWTFCDNISNQWIQLYSINMLKSINLPSAFMLHDGLSFHIRSKLFRCDVESGDVKEVVCMDQLRYGRERAGAFEYDNWGNVHTFNSMPYMESLVPVTRAIHGKLHTDM